MRKSALIAVTAFALAGAADARQSAGEVSRANQDTDNRPAQQSMQTVGGLTSKPGVNAEAPPAGPPTTALGADDLAREKAASHAARPQGASQSDPSPSNIGASNTGASTPH